MTTADIIQLLEQHAQEVQTAIHQLHEMARFGIELAADSHSRAQGASTLIAALGHLMVSKGLCTGAELSEAAEKCTAAGVVGDFLFRAGYQPPEESAEEPGDQYPEDAVVFGGR